MDNKEFVWTEEVVKEFSEYLIVRRSYDLKDINQHVSDFKKLKKRIVVVVEATNDGRPEHVAYMGNRIPKEKYSKIKGVIEMVLNDENKFPIPVEISYGAKSIISEDDYNRDIQNAEERAFNAGKEMIDYCTIKKYPTFQDYINHQRDKK